MNETIDKTAIRHAATVLLVRNERDGPHVLMGQRGASAAFMPDKFVFPGGAVDVTDADVPLACPLGGDCAARLSQDAPGANALAAAAVRELWEETGLMLGGAGHWHNPPADWTRFADHGLLPDASGLRYIFRAITPPGRTRRFDARFFLADVENIVGDPDDFSEACDELAHLHWVPFTQARKLNLPFITEVVLAEAHARIMGEDMPASVPFFDNSTGLSCFRRIA